MLQDGGSRPPGLLTGWHIPAQLEPLGEETAWVPSTEHEAVVSPLFQSRNRSVQKSYVYDQMSFGTAEAAGVSLAAHRLAHSRQLEGLGDEIAWAPSTGPEAAVSLLLQNMLWIGMKSQRFGQVSAKYESLPCSCDGCHGF